MVIFHSYVCLPEGTSLGILLSIQGPTRATPRLESLWRSLRSFGRISRSRCQRLKKTLKRVEQKTLNHLPYGSRYNRYKRFSKGLCFDHKVIMNHSPIILPEKRLGSTANALHRIMPMCNVRMPRQSGYVWTIFSRPGMCLRSMLNYGQHEETREINRLGCEKLIQMSTDSDQPCDHLTSPVTYRVFSEKGASNP